MNTILHHSPYVRYLLLTTMVSSCLLVGCVTPDYNNPFVGGKVLLQKLKEINNSAAKGDTITVRTFNDDRYTFSGFSIDLLEARGVLLSYQLNPNNKPNQDIKVDSVLTIPRKEIYSTKVHNRMTNNDILGGFGIGMLLGYMTAGGVDIEQRNENRNNGLSASTYHITALATGAVLSIAMLASKNDDHNKYYYFCPNDNCESINRDLDRIYWEGSFSRW
jgi:hypothetical protein